MIPSLEQLENHFLSVASENGFRVVEKVKMVDMDAVLSVELAKSDIAMFARLLIQAYGGWPFYPQILRRRILTTLLRIYNSIS